MITNETRQQKVRELPEAVFSIYTSDELTRAIGKCLSTYEITDGKDSFIDIVGDTLIGLVPRSKFEQKLVTAIYLTPEVARAVAQELRPFFDKAEGSVHADALEAKERLELRPHADAPVGGEKQGTLGDHAVGAQPLTREELMNALAGKRTMAQDIEALREKREALKSGVSTTPVPLPPTQPPQPPTTPIPPSH